MLEIKWDMKLCVVINDQSCDNSETRDPQGDRRVLSLTNGKGSYDACP